jgi:hypothetical protein
MGMRDFSITLYNWSYARCDYYVMFPKVSFYLKIFLAGLLLCHSIEICTGPLPSLCIMTLNRKLKVIKLKLLKVIRKLTAINTGKFWSGNTHNHARFQVLTAASMKMTTF